MNRKIYFANGEVQGQHEEKSISRMVKFKAHFFVSGAETLKKWAVCYPVIKSCFVWPLDPLEPFFESEIGPRVRSRVAHFY